MALEYRDRVRDQTTTTGTGTFTVAGSAPTGYRTITSAFTDGATVRYTAFTQDLTEWEVGQGVWTASGTTLTRATIYASSNAGAAVNFSAGTKLLLIGPVVQDVTDRLPLTGGTLTGAVDITNLGLAAPQFFIAAGSVGTAGTAAIDLQSGNGSGGGRTIRLAVDQSVNSLDVIDVTSGRVIARFPYDAGPSIRDHTDNTKIAQLLMSSIATGTTRQYTFPDKTGTFAMFTDVRSVFQTHIQAGASHAGNTTLYYSSAGAEGAQGNANFQVPFAGVISDLFVNTGGSPGGSETYIFTIMKNNSATGVTATISAGGTVASDTTNSFSVVAGDQLNVRMTSSASASSTGGVSATFILSRT